jgi:hypothetical protein
VKSVTKTIIDNSWGEIKFVIIADMEHEFFGLKKKFGIEIEIYSREKKLARPDFGLTVNHLGSLK